MSPLDVAGKVTSLLPALLSSWFPLALPGTVRDAQASRSNLATALVEPTVEQRPLRSPQIAMAIKESVIKATREVLTKNSISRSITKY